VAALCLELAGPAAQQTQPAIAAEKLAAAEIGQQLHRRMAEPDIASQA
jgi:hypothetical protein